MIALAVRPPFKHELDICSLIDQVLEHMLKPIKILFLSALVIRNYRIKESDDTAFNLHF